MSFMISSLLYSAQKQAKSVPQSYLKNNNNNTTKRKCIPYMLNDIPYTNLTQIQLAPVVENGTEKFYSLCSLNLIRILQDCFQCSKGEIT